MAGHSPTSTSSTTPAAPSRCAAEPSRRCSPSTTSSTSPTRSTSRSPVAPTCGRRVPPSVAGATAIAVPSEFVASTLIDAFGIDPARIVVVPHGYDPPARSSLPPADELRRRYRLGDRRVLVYPAITHPHKGHRLLVELLAGPWADPDLVLVLLGRRRRRRRRRVGGDRRARRRRPGRAPGAGSGRRPRRSDRPRRGARVPIGVRGLRRARCSRRWRSARRWSAATVPPCPRSPATPRVVLPPTVEAWAGRPRHGRRHPRRAGRARPSSGRAGSPSPRQAQRWPRPTDSPRARWRDVRLVVLCPHFEPDSAPTGRVMTRIVEELAARGHHVDVVTALPWYRHHRVEPGGRRPWLAGSPTSWGSITRVNPFAGDDKRNLARRAIGFVGFSALALGAGIAAGGWFRRADGVIAMSPPLTMGVTGRLVAWTHRCPLVFNIQDVFPDAAVATGAVTNPAVVAAASWLERVSYRLADAVTVLSDDLAANVAGKLPAGQRSQGADDPQLRRHRARSARASRMTRYRQELGIGDEPVVLYAGNVGFSQSLDLIVAAARQLPDVTFVVNGDGSMRGELEAARSRRGERPVRRLRPGRPPRRAARHRRSPRRAAAPRPRQGQCPVEDLLDPCRRAARARRHRCGDGDPAPPRRVGGRSQRRARRPSSGSPPPSPSSSPTVSGSPRWARRDAAGWSRRPPRRGRRPTYEALIDELQASGCRAQ